MHDPRAIFEALKIFTIGYNRVLSGMDYERIDIPLSHDLVNIIAKIDEFKGRWHALKTLAPDRLTQLRRVAAIESIGSSTRIEGAKLSDNEVETLLSGLNKTHFKTRDEQEVAGYAETMDVVLQSSEDIKLTENHVCQLHQMLLRHSSKDARHRGSYKALENNVVAIDKKGNEIGIVFQTASPFDTPREMEALITWVNKSISEQRFHPLITVGVFIVQFLAIHPFQDGNGRLSRILTTLMLLQAGYAYVPYASMESVVEKNKDLYYKALRRTQKTLRSPHADWEPWIGFFLRCMKKQKDILSDRLEDTHAASLIDPNVNPLSARILRLFEKNTRLTLANIVELTQANRNTIKVRMRELVAAGTLKQHGKARATWYTL